MAARVYAGAYRKLHEKLDESRIMRVNESIRIKEFNFQGQLTAHLSHQQSPNRGRIRRRSHEHRSPVTNAAHLKLLSERHKCFHYR